MIRQLALGLALGAATLGLGAAAAGAVELPAPPVTDHAVIVTFRVEGADQIVEAVETAPPSDGLAYERMIELRDKLADGCGVHQLDHFPPGVPVPTVGQVYPPNTPGAISAIPHIVGTGSCDETTTTTEAPPTTAPATTEAPTTTSTEAPVIDATTTIPAPTVGDYTPTTAAPDAPAQAVELEQAQATTRPATLPSTGAHSLPAVLFACSLMILGAAGVLVARSGRFAR